MQDGFYGGLYFGASGVRISIINFKKELKFSHNIAYENDFKNPNSWINSCEKLLHKLPLYIKSNIVNLSISGTSGTLTAFDLKGDPIGEALPYYHKCEENKNLIQSITNGKDYLQNSYSSLAKALKLIDRYGENILLRHQSDWISGWFLKNWTYGEEGNNLKLGWDVLKQSWPINYLNNSWQKCLPQIIKSGKIMGQIDSGVAKRLKLNNKLLLISGTTYSNATFLAAGLDKEVGLTILGTAIVIKKINKKPIKEKGIKIDKIYENWISGGKLNVGCGILSKFYSDLEIKELSRQINISRKTSLNLLPFNSNYEGNPFNEPFLDPIIGPRPVSDSLYLQALFEGLARVELKGWEKLYEFTGSLPKRIVTVGEGSKNPQWRAIREQIINIPIVSCRKTASFGTALLAIDPK